MYSDIYDYVKNSVHGQKNQPSLKAPTMALQPASNNKGMVSSWYGFNWATNRITRVVIYIDFY